MGKVLAATMYDPAVLDTLFNVGSPAAMTAIDTTNLRLTFNAPTSGRVRVRLSGVSTDTNVQAVIMLGVLDGSTVKLRVGAWGSKRRLIDAEGIVTGLTPGTSYTWDAAYGVEVDDVGIFDAGGPNNTTADDAAGGFMYTIEEA